MINSSLLSSSSINSISSTSYTSQTVEVMDSESFTASLAMVGSSKKILFPSECCMTSSLTISLFTSSCFRVMHISPKVSRISPREKRLIKLLQNTNFAPLVSDASEWLSFLKSYKIESPLLSYQLVDHRFKHIQCPKNTAIKIKRAFIHANYIKLGISSFIAMQAPWTPHLQNLFWISCMRSVSSNLILDFSKRREENLQPSLQAEKDKCGLTYPERIGSSLYFGGTHSIKVTCVSFVKTIDLTVSTLTIREFINDLQHEKSMLRIHFSIWPESVPESINQIVKTIYNLIANVHYLKFESNIPHYEQETPIVLCENGVDKACSFIACMALNNAYHEFNSKNLERLISYIILTIREDRGPNFPTGERQLINLYNFAKSLLRKS